MQEMPLKKHIITESIMLLYHLPNRDCEKLKFVVGTHTTLLYKKTMN